ncbi:MAG: hypothetical protein SVM79_08015, partial [Chloroflexota bacterium]|nr:hypothetical protein [Chloroflexota bacterium]
VTNVGELPWLVRDNKEGRIAAYGDTRAMSDAILHALRNPDSLVRMGQNAHARVTSLSPRFGAESIAETWRGLLSSITNKEHL